MSMAACKIIISAVFAVGVIPISVAHANPCAAVLQNGTFKETSYRENNYFLQIIYSRFMSASFQQSKTDKALGFGVPVGEVVLGGDYTEAQFKQKKQQLQKTAFNQIQSSREIDVALASGDATIVGAWLECIRTAGGAVALRLTPQSATEVFAEVSWFPGRAGTRTGHEASKILEDVQFPDDVKVTGGARCFAKDTPLTESPCLATIILPDATTTLALSINTEYGSAQAYLPQRLRYQRDVETYQFTEKQQLKTTAQNGDLYPSDAITLPQEKITDGWSFDPASAAAPVQVIINERWVNTCTATPIEVDLYSFKWGFHAHGNQKTEKDRKHSITCRVLPRINMVRDRWVPANQSGASM